MESDRTSQWARRLQEALGRQGVTPQDSALLERIVGEWNRARARRQDKTAGADQPLFLLEATLRQHGITLEGQALARVAWALLGVPVAGQLRLGEARWSRLTHLTELHDVTLPSAARALARQLAQEAHLVGDLLHARPWLRESGQGKAEDVLAAIFESEWTGFLALLGEFGPWVYVPTVSDLQGLSHLYTRLVHAAAESRDAEVLAAALEFQAPEETLLIRLETTDYRQPGKLREPHTPLEDGRQLAEAERAFWNAAEDQARQRRTEWAARRRA